MDRFTKTVSLLRGIHAELLRLEAEGKMLDARENPGLIGEYLVKLRLHANLLFSFINNYLDELNDALKEVAKRRQALYEEQLALGKSPNQAETMSRERTRVEEADVKIIENKISQIRNEYERYNGIAMALQSRLKEFGVERMVDGR